MSPRETVWRTCVTFLSRSTERRRASSAPPGRLPSPVPSIGTPLSIRSVDRHNRTAPKTSRQCGEKKQRQCCDNQQTSQKNEILRLEHHAQHVELACWQFFLF